MFGVKINEFDNSDGTIETFNKIFPRTPLENSCAKYVEIGDIVKFAYISQGSPFLRKLIFFDHNYKEINRVDYDFGESNFYDNQDYLVDTNIRFKYFAKDLDGNVIAKAYNYEDLAKQLNCNVGTVKRRLDNGIKDVSLTKYLFTVTRKEL